MKTTKELPPNEVVRADELNEGDVLVTFLVGRGEYRLRAVTRLGVDGHWVHVGMGEGSPLSYMGHEKIRRLVRT